MTLTSVHTAAFQTTLSLMGRTKKSDGTFSVVVGLFDSQHAYRDGSALPPRNRRLFL